MAILSFSLFSQRTSFLLRPAVTSSASRSSSASCKEQMVRFDVYGGRRNQHGGALVLDRTLEDPIVP
jgi:hypothetical protein